MRAVILYNNEDIFVEFPPEKFAQLLKVYLEAYKDVDKAIEKIIEDLKKETKYK